MRILVSTGFGAMLALALVPSIARAEPGESDSVSGASSAEIVEMGAVHRLDDLRFGAFPSPASAERMTIDPDGTVSATGALNTTMNSFSSPDGRGPARFRIQGTNNRMFIPFIPNRLTITNGSSTMLIDRLDDNVFPIGRFDADGRFIYQVGGRLNVSANQAPGHYRGEFTLTVLFL